MRHQLTALAALAIVLAAASCSVENAPSASLTPATPVETPAAPSQQESQPNDYLIGLELTPGTHSSHVFDTPLTFTVPAGWKVFEDERGQFGLARLVNDGPCLCVWRDVRVASPDFPKEVPAEGVGATAREIVDALAERSGIDAGPATPVQVGGLDGFVIDLHLASGSPGAPTLIGTEISRGVYWGVAAGSEQRVWVLDLDTPATGNIAINAEVCCGAEWDEQLAAVAEVVASFEFGP